MKTIAIIGAMREEITPLLDYIGDYEALDYAKNTYYKAKYSGYNLVIGYSKIGKIHAAITASTMILKFNADCVLFTGVAGGIADELRVGDLVLATSICQYDVDISAFGHPLGFIPESSVYINSDETLNSIARKVAIANNIRLKEGIIASGDSFIFSSEKKKWILNNFNAIAVEMEGASIAVSANSFNVPFCVIRSISDTADENADVSFDEFLMDSANRSVQFIIGMLDLITASHQI